jgi:TPR repeat protein
VQNRAAPANVPPTAAAVSPATTAPAPVPAPSVVAPPARQLDAEEIAVLMKRAKDLLASGDIPPARLLLRRAADAQEATAALLLAQTYDPEVLGTKDVRQITPDIAMARTWYQRAAQLGSADAQRRLAQLQD